MAAAAIGLRIPQTGAAARLSEQLEFWWKFDPKALKRMMLLDCLNCVIDCSLIAEWNWLCEISHIVSGGAECVELLSGKHISVNP